MRGALSAAGLAALAACVGCATNNAALEEELSRLRREVRTLNQKISEDDLKIERLEGRVTLLALGQSGEVAPAPKTPAVGATEKPPPAPRPAKVEQPKINQLTGPQRSLPVVKFGTSSDEDGSFEQGAIDDGSPPIVIKLEGDQGDDLPIDHGVLAKPDPVLDSPKKKSAPADEEEDDAPPKKVTKSEIKAAYEIALAKLRIDNDPAAARKLLNRFAKRYPASELADNVAFWTAECDFAEGKHEEAIKSFHRMIEAFPKSPKVPDAIVRQGESRAALGEPERAEVLFARVIAKWPDSEAAKKAKALLQGAAGRR